MATKKKILGSLRPPSWTADEIRRDAATSLELFKNQRRDYTRVYRSQYERAHKLVCRLFELSCDLSEFDEKFFLRFPDGELIWAARYLAVPPISADDLVTLAGAKKINRKRPDPSIASAIVREIKLAIDEPRCCWLSAKRLPTAAERVAAIGWTASILAVELTRTIIRNQASKIQEKVVVEAITRAGYIARDDVKSVRTAGDLGPGFFVPREVSLKGTKADKLVHLRDGRLLPIECKVSNTEVNSYKRLNESTVNKAQIWRRSLGEDGVVVAAVLSGAFKVSNVLDAQESHGVFVVWQHGADVLEVFARNAI